VIAPGAGSVAAESRGRLRRSRASGRAEPPRQQLLARARRNAPAAGRVTLVLRLRKRWRGELRRRRRISARTVVTYDPAGAGRPLGRAVRVAFELPSKRSRTRRRG
jgi:hypothetical protein